MRELVRVFYYTPRVGGGPAPILSNPSPASCRHVTFLHIALFILAGLLITLVILLDRSCSTDSSFMLYTISVMVTSFGIAFLFFVMSTTSNATEKEWGLYVIMILTATVIEIGAVTLGVWKLVEHTINFAQIHKECPINVFYWGSMFTATCCVAVLIYCGQIVPKFVTDIVSQYQMFETLV